MSAWRIAVTELHTRGGGPVPSRVLGSDPQGLRRARDLGLLWHLNGTHWQLTGKGRAFVEGRVTVTEPKTGRMGRGKMQFVATWLAALPPCNAVRITPEGVHWVYRPPQPRGA